MDNGITRREFSRRIVIAGVTVSPLLTAHAKVAAQPPSDDTPGFPSGNYTPFGYLDNPYHTWDLHRSGVIRSAPALGFGFYFPAGPGGYFDYTHDAIYHAVLRVGFIIAGKRYLESDDFDPGQLRATHHSKNLFTFSFDTTDAKVAVTMFQAEENALVARIEINGNQSLSVLAVHEYHLGAESWWGRDGLTAAHRATQDSVISRSFAAGTVCALAADQHSDAHVIVPTREALDAWTRHPEAGSSLTFDYFPQSLFGAMRYNLSPGQPAAMAVVLARAPNEAAARRSAEAAIAGSAGVLHRKHAEDDGFWSRAPQLEGDWPDHWRHGWVYDFETLRMMVRKPIGAYHHPWDAMQIQAPRNVLAETSIDMWALSYADPETAKSVLLGQYLDALSPNVPCMRESAFMNMVAVDGSECGTSISWCWPVFCAASIADREGDVAWLRRLYPHLARLIDWTLAQRSDAQGFIVGKCSWETGMDSSERFLIQQPTGGELIEFIRVVELQAAMSQAGAILARFAQQLGLSTDVPRWRGIERTYAMKTQQLWNGRDWFQDFDTRSNHPIVPKNAREITQCAPIFCGIANAAQIRAMLPLLHQYREHPDYYLEWPSLVLPYVESLWTAGDYEFLSEVVHDIADRIYRSIDRHAEESGSAPERLGWPGVSCEMWGLHGARGGEGYGWGATMPAHIIRSIIGFRETGRPNELWLSPNVPKALARRAKTYSVTGLRYKQDALTLTYFFGAGDSIDVRGSWQGTTRVIAVRDAAGGSVPLTSRGAEFSFAATNHNRYTLVLSRS